MKILKNCIKLSSIVKIYVPSTIDVTNYFDSKEWTKKTLEFLSAKFGGATASSALGAWITTNNSLLTENITVCFAYAQQTDLEKNIESIYEFCLEMKKQLTQEAIALEVNGELYLL